jgi:hypothetical protein
MTAVVARGMLFISIWCVINIADYTRMLSCFIDMAVKRPHRPVTQGTGD